MDDKAWLGGLDARWGDIGKTHVFRHQFNIQRAIHINTELAKEDDIKSLDDLLDPKWKGKIVTSDVTQGYVYTPSTLVRELKGDDFLRKLFVDQQPIIIRDRRQAVETLVRGGGSIGYGLHPIIMGDFVRDGLAGHIRNPAVPGRYYERGRDNHHLQQGAASKRRRWCSSTGCSVAMVTSPGQRRLDSIAPARMFPRWTRRAYRAQKFRQTCRTSCGCRRSPRHRTL